MNESLSDESVAHVAPHDRRRWATPVLIGCLLAMHVLAASYLAHLNEPSPDSWQGSFFADQGRLNEIVDSPGRPYRDFDVEYPPLILGELHVLMSHDPTTTLARFAWSQLALEMVVIAGLGWGWGRRAVLAYLVLSLPLVAFPFVFARTDMLASALAVVGVAAVAKSRANLGAMCLAVAAFAKLWPIVVVPILLAQRHFRAFALAAGIGAIGLLAWTAWGGVSAPLQVVTFRHADGWSIESGVGNVWQLVAQAPPVERNDSFRVGHSPTAETALLALIGIGGVCWMWWRAAQAPEDAHLNFGIAPLGSVAILLLAAPLFSAQYVAWLLPWTAIAIHRLDPGAGIRRELTHRSVADAALAVIVFGICAVTAVMYRLYGKLLDGNRLVELMVTTRNLGVAAVIFLCAWCLVDQRIQATA